MGFVPYTGSSKKAAIKATSEPHISFIIPETLVFGWTVTEFLVITISFAIIIGILVLVYILCFVANKQLNSSSLLEKKKTSEDTDQVIVLLP